MVEKSAVMSVATTFEDKLVTTKSPVAPPADIEIGEPVTAIVELGGLHFIVTRCLEFFVSARSQAFAVILAD